VFYVLLAHLIKFISQIMLPVLRQPPPPPKKKKIRKNIGEKLKYYRCGVVLTG